MKLKRITIISAVSAAAFAMTLGGTAVAGGIDDRNCDSFGSIAELEEYVSANPGDPSRLDADDDGIACEGLYPPGVSLVDSSDDDEDDNEDDNNNDDTDEDDTDEDDDTDDAPVATPMEDEAQFTG